MEKRDEKKKDSLLPLPPRDKLLILLYSAGLDWRILPWGVVFIYSILLTQSKILIFHYRLGANSWSLYGDILFAAIRDLIKSGDVITFPDLSVLKDDSINTTHILISPKGKKQAQEIENSFPEIGGVILKIQKVLPFFEDLDLDDLIDLANQKET